MWAECVQGPRSLRANRIGSSAGAGRVDPDCIEKDNQ